MHQRSGTHSRVVHARSAQSSESRSVKKMRSAVGEVVYAVLMPDGTIKIGWTADFGQRKQRLGATCRVLSLWPGSIEDEQAIHARLRAHRARGREYYRRTAEVIGVINEMRANLGLAPLT